MSARVAGSAAMSKRMANWEGPKLTRGDTWRPRGSGVAREIIGHAIGSDGAAWVNYRTRHGEFASSEREFRFWIERMQAWVVGPIDEHPMSSKAS